MPTVDLRPKRLDLVLRRGEVNTLLLNWYESLAGRNLSATVGEESLTVEIDDDLLTLTIPVDATAIPARGATWVLVDDDEDRTILTGRVSSSSDGSASSSHSATVALSNGSVSVSVVAGGFAAHLIDPIDAHDASAISFTPAAGIAATDVQTAIVEILADISGTYVHAALAVDAPAETVTLDLSDGITRRYVTLDEDTTLAVTNDEDQPVFLVIVGTGAGGFDLTFWDGIQWATEGGEPPTVTPEADARDVFSFIKLGPLDYLGFVVGQGLAVPVPVEVPDAPTGIVAVAGNTAADVSFTPGDDGGSARTGCRITPYIAGVAQTPQVFLTTATTQTVTGLTNGTAYTFKVEDKNAVGYSAESAASNAVTPDSITAPGAPTAVVGTSGNAQVSVAFTPPVSDGGSAITGYTATSSPGGITASGASSPIVVPGLTNGTAYTFTVHATNAIGNSAESSPSAAVTPATTPGAPTIGTATAGDTEATANWTAPASTGGSAITGYEVKTYDNAGTLLHTNTVGVVLTYLKTGLTNGTAVKFKVAAINAVGTGTQSAFSNAVTPDSAVFDYSTLPNKVANYDARDITGFSDNDFLTLWEDSFAVSPDLTASGGRRPTYDTAGIGSLPGVIFDGASNAMRSSSFTAITQPMTFYLVANVSNAANTAYLFDGGASNQMALARQPGGSLYLAAPSGSVAGAMSAGLHVITAQFNDPSGVGGGGIIRVDGTQVGGTLSPGSNTLASLSLGGDGAPGDDGFLNTPMVVGHWLAFNAAHNGTVMAQVEGALKAIWGTP